MLGVTGLELPLVGIGTVNQMHLGILLSILLLGDEHENKET